MTKVKKERIPMSDIARKELRKRTATSYAFVLPYFLCFCLFTVLPVLISIFFSFTSFNILEPPDFIGIDNYIRMFFKDSIFLIALKNTLLIAIVTGPIGYLLSLLMAWFINELTPKFRAFVTLIFYAPTISGNVYMIWSLLFSGDSYGYINSTLIRLGVIQAPIQFLKNTAYMMPIVIGVSLWMSLGAGFLSFIAGFQGVDKSYYEAAAMDGIKNRWQELWFVTLPMMRNQMMFSAVMSITSSFNVGGVVTGLFGFPSTDYAVHTIMNHLEDYGGTRFEMGYASAIATLLFIIMVGVNLVVRRLVAKVGS